jgi:hypothetical protein
MALSTCACGSLWLAQAVAAQEAPIAQVAAESPMHLAVTVYRAPGRAQGSINLDYLDGFALVSEKRRVSLPAGESRLRFDGVSDGIQAQSAIVTGLPDGIIEKNRDAKLLSPSALVAATVGKSMELVRTDRKTGKPSRLPGTILSDAGGGVVFSTAAGVEALRCSGLAETFDFETGGAPSARPSLSVLVRTPTAVTAEVTLSYLSRGFDWAADYSATLAPDGRSMDLGAWVTLANSNATGFPSANTQIVAGRVNREDGAVEPIDSGSPILARCWPRGSTSDSPPRLLRFARASSIGGKSVAMMMNKQAAALQEVTLTAMRKVEQEQLGDLKLYRLPEPTTVASRQSKQVRLLDRAAIPVTTFYRVELRADPQQESFTAERMLRTVNDTASHLGLPLPSGSVAVFSQHEAGRLLLHESSLRDLAVNEKVEIDLGVSSDVQVAVAISRTGAREQTQRVTISNARPESIRMELRLTLQDGAQVIRADHPFESKDSRPTFKLTVPAQGTAALRYQIRYQTQGQVP